MAGKKSLIYLEYYNKHCNFAENFTMTQLELQQYLLREYPQENARCEWKEFKNLKNSFCGDEKDDVISYVSAIANMEGGFLVIGVHDKTLEIVGTDTYNYDRQKATLRLTDRCANLSSEGLDIMEYITSDTRKKVWVIRIPKHLPKRPVYAHDKAWQRIEDSLIELTPERLNAILDEPLFTGSDWSAEIVPNATIDDLDEVAIAKARVMFKKVHSRIPAEEVNAWSVSEFLSNAGVMIDGGITRAAIILLGKPVSVFKLRPAVLRVTWSLRDEKQEVVDYEHFTAPFILTVDQILAKVRNVTMRELPGGTLFPEVMQQYDDYSMREILHNCIAHQDYTLQERINLVESPGFLYYANGGSFIPGTVQKALATHGPQRHYRNECLCQAMVNFNMIDIVGRGIRKIFNQQWERRFPMPDYEIDAAKKEVAVRLYGNAINEKYTNLLKENKELSFEDCLLLDAVQKGHQLNEADAQNLLSRGLIEVQDDRYYISLDVARKTKQVSEYTRSKGLEKQKLIQMILQYLKNAGEDGSKRDGIYEYLKDVLPSNKTEEQRLRALGDLLKTMKADELIKTDGRNWFLK
jgi:ATP-dependent DNA helicase RecG